MQLESHGFSCPWCGEPNELPLDPDEVGQTVVQDCAVCCRPIEITFSAEADERPAIDREGG